jgi:putative component of membrane protein insertase Oxa1/YidC/SpoIIIJ protein YidD
MKNNYPEFTNRCIATLLILIFVIITNSPGIDSLQVAEGTGQKNAPVFFLDFYQHHLSPLRGSHCPMYPSCSEYARKVIERYSSLQAYPLICDRLLRCGHDFNTYTDTIIEQHLRWKDIPYPKIVIPFINASDSVQRNTEGPTVVPTNGLVADFLYKNGFYEQAYFEYVRSFSYERDSATVLKAAFAAYHAYDYHRFTHEISSLIKLLSKEQSSLSGELYLLTAKRGYAEGLYSTAYTVLEKYQQFFNTPILYEEYRLLATVTALFSGIDSVPDLTIKDFSAESPLVSYLGRIDSLNRSLDRLRPRSAVAAGLLSAIVPGSGYVIGDRKRTALFALLFNGLLAWSTIEFVGQENYGAATFSVLLGSGFYIGSIVGSMRSVDSYNLRKRHSLIKQSLHDLDVDP